MAIFRKYLIPDRVYPNMSDVPFEQLHEMGFRYALLDLDNTLAEDHIHEPTDYTRDIISRLEKTGFTCCIVSNAKSSRSADFAAMIPVQCISYANKPSPSGIYKALDLLGAKKEETVFFGDQIFTDIAAAKRAGIFAVLIEPYNKKEVLYVKLKRPFEKIVRCIYRF
jgi:HAD superfamily phosphatase (TIGR01668 family)